MHGEYYEKLKKRMVRAFLAFACEVMLAGPLDQLVQLVLDSELVGLRVPNLPHGRREAPFRQSLEDLLDSLEAQAGRFHEHRDCLLYVAHQESLVENSRFRAADEDGRQGPGRFVLDLHGEY